MPDLARVDIEQDEIGWVLRISNPGMRAQEYRCATKEQAQKLAAVMTGKAQGSNQPAAAGAKPPAKR